MAERGEDRAEVSEELGPLPGGHHRLSREQISDSQRERLLAAMAQEVARSGYRKTKITEVSKIASVSTRDFYLLYENKEECFLAAFETVRNHLQTLVLAAAAEEDDWPQQVIAVLRTSLEFFAAEPDLARFCLLGPVSSTAKIAVHFRDAVLACIPALARGRDYGSVGDSLPQSTEDSILGGIVSLATRTIAAGEAERLPDLLPVLVDFALSSYLGAEQAGRLAEESAAA